MLLVLSRVCPTWKIRSTWATTRVLAMLKLFRTRFWISSLRVGNVELHRGHIQNQLSSIIRASEAIYEC
uniref:Uncharacterized protein n=1 Tax=Arundo donax TaxID=35708 RepID=A0A0A9ABW5_ARUDO